MLSRTLASTCKTAFRRPTATRLMSTTATEEEDMVLFNVDAEGFATITLNRPKVHNAFSDVVIGKLSDRLDQAAVTPGLRGLFFRSNGKNFSAGGDLEWMKRAAGYTREENINDAMALSRMLHKIGNLPVPSIALVQGAAFGGGVGLVSACDIAVGVEASSFMLSEVRLGLIPATISPYVIRRIGAQQCRRYFLTAERFDAGKALSMGLLHEVVKDVDEMEAMAQSMKKSIAGNSPTGVAASKELIDAVVGRHIDESVMLDTAERLADQRKSVEGIEGITAFFDKRSPAWLPESLK